MERLETEIKDLREKNEAAETRASDAERSLDERARSHAAEKAEMESGFLQEKAQLMLDWEKEKSDMLAQFAQEKADLKADHVKDKKDTKMEAERASHLENSQQRYAMQNLQAENRQLRSKNEDGC